MLPNSLAVEVDTYRNTGWATDIDGNHVAVDLNGDVTNSVAAQGVSPLMNNGAVWTAWVDYNGTTGQLEVRLSETTTGPLDAILSYSVDLPSITNTMNLFFGFSAGIAGGQENHDILNWAVTNAYAPFGLPAPDPDALLQQLLADVAGVGPGKSLSNKVTLAQTYYAAGDIPAACARGVATGEGKRTSMYGKNRPGAVSWRQRQSFAPISAACPAAWIAGACPEIELQRHRAIESNCMSVN